MNLTELKVARIRRGIKAQTIANALDKTVDSYIKRENGNVGITISDAFIITNVLHLSLTEFVTIFLTGTYLSVKIMIVIIISVNSHFLCRRRERGRVIPKHKRQRHSIFLSPHIARENEEKCLSL